MVFCRTLLLTTGIKLFIILSVLVFSFFTRIVCDNTSAGAAQALVTCFGSVGCAGSSTSNISPRVCCVGTGVSYNDGVSCFECIGKWRVVCLD